ncbi:MAG: hypothetical protein H5T97_01995 [Firmicutes bacterium]|nr:hypothetical protein [Bacillota bacterium]
MAVHVFKVRVLDFAVPVEHGSDGGQQVPAAGIDCLQDAFPFVQQPVSVHEIRLDVADAFRVLLGFGQQNIGEIREDAVGLRVRVQPQPGAGLKVPSEFDAGGGKAASCQFGVYLLFFGLQHLVSFPV